MKLITAAKHPGPENNELLGYKEVPIAGIYVLLAPYSLWSTIFNVKLDFDF